MTDARVTSPTDADPEAGTPSDGRPRWPVVVVAVVAILLVGAIAGAVVANRNDSPAYAAPQIGAMHDGCQQWAAADPSVTGDQTTSEWCGSMAEWMDTRAQGQMGAMAGQGQMMGAAMWQSPDSMRTTCEQWMAESPNAAPSGTDPTATCDQMVTWMTEHMGDWNGGMMNGPMMGQPPTTG